MKSFTDPSTDQLITVATAAIENYEFSCSWARAYNAAAEFAREEGLVVRPSAIAASIIIAKARWESLSVGVKAAL